MALEKERKFLVDIPTKIKDLQDMADCLVDIKEISQFFLKKTDEGYYAPRIRKSVSLYKNKKTTYTYTLKKQTKTIGINEEKEKEISEKEFKEFRNKKDESLKEIKKVRYDILYENQYFELDLFQNEYSGLAILELEMKDLNDKINFPKFLDVLKEVTKDPKYNNYQLAKGK